MRDDLILRLANRLDSRDPAATAEALRAVPTFQGDLTWLERLFRAGEVLPPVPEQLAARLDSLLDGASVPHADDIVEPAVQIHDSRVHGELVGVRSMGSPTPEAWTVIYSTPAADLLIDGTPLHDGRTRLAGQLLHRSGQAGPFQISGDALDEPVPADDHGRFILGAFENGRYDFAIHAERFPTSWTIDVGQ